MALSEGCPHCSLLEWLPLHGVREKHIHRWEESTWLYGQGLQLCFQFPKARAPGDPLDGEAGVWILTELCPDTWHKSVYSLGLSLSQGGAGLEDL